jgi:hypothetical protein
VGDFTDPPWEEKVDLEYNEICGLFYTNYLEELRVEPGQYRFKFIVDGEWLCDGNYPINKESDGNVNNLITIGASRSTMFRVSSFVAGDMSELTSNILPGLKQGKE